MPAHLGAYQNLSGVSATEWRQRVAHGVSRGSESVSKTSRGAAKECGTAFFLSPRPGLGFPTQFPQLALWATVWRCSAAIFGIFAEYKF